jgi:hypothetical protein
MYNQGNLIPDQTLSFPLFGGDSGEDFYIWRKTVKDKLNFLQWGDGSFLRFLPTILNGRASHYYENLDKSNIYSIDDALQALQDKFGIKNKSFLQKISLFDRTQRDNEKVADYTNDILHNFDKLGLKDENIKLILYLRGLKPELRYECLKFQPANLQALEDLARSIELSGKSQDDSNYSEILEAIKDLSAELEKVKELSNDNQSQPFVSMPFCRYCGCRHIYGQHVSIQNTYPSMGRQSNQFYSQPEAYHYQQSSSSFPDPQCFNPSIICYQCGERGHIARKCRHYVPSNYLNIQGTSNA